MKIKFNKSVVIKIFIIVLSIIGFIFISIWAYRQYKEFKEPLLPAINAIPDNTVFFVEIKNYNELWSKLNQPYSIWKKLTEIPSFNQINKQIVFLDSLIKTNPEINNILNSQPVLMAITFNSINEFNTIFLVNYSKKQQTKTIIQFIGNFKQNDYQINDLTKDEIPLFKLATKKTNKAIYYSLFKGVFIVGQSKSEVFASVLKLNSNEPLTKKEAYNKIYNTAGKNVEANFYLNLQFAQILLKNLLNKEYSLLTQLKTINNGWMTLDIKMKENIFLLNGFTNNTDTVANILNLFKNEEPQTINVTNILPDNTSMYLLFGYKDFSKFGTSLTGLNNNKINESKVNNINKHFDIEIEKYFKYWIGKEIVMFSTHNVNKDDEIFNYLAINTIDKNITSEKLDELAEKTTDKSNLNIESAIYKGYKINFVNIPDLLPLFFGFMADNIKQNYFTIIDSYVVFGNSTEALQQLINKSLLRQTLIKNTTYNSFAENISDKASIYLYVNVPKYLIQLSNIVNPKYRATIEHNYKIFEQFQSFALQITPENNLYYNTICIDYKTISLNKPTNILWQLDLDTTINSKPIVVKNFSNKSNEILISDAANKLYLIDKNGKILWKRAINERIMSNIYQIDFYRNGKLQFLFNTENHIYLIDHNAKDVEDFPIKLKSKATNGMLAVYYPDLSDYRIYLACENKKIICLSKSASLVDGWQFKNTENIVSKPIQHFIINNSDYLTITDNIGKIYIIDRKGISKIELNKSTVISDKNNIILSRTNNNKETSLVFTNKIGEIISIQIPNGKVTTLKIDEFSPNHYFLYADINNDKKKEYLFVDNTKLKIYNWAQKLIYNYQFINPITSIPLLIDQNEQLLKFGITDNKTSQLLLFSYSNSTFNLKETLPCSNFFTTTLLIDNNQLNIITISDKTIYNYAD